jgi:hypothetical protein
MVHILAFKHQWVVLKFQIQHIVANFVSIVVIVIDLVAIWVLIEIRREK